MLPYPEHPLLTRDFGVRPWAETDLACIEQASLDRHITAGTSVPTSYTTNRSRGRGAATAALSLVKGWAFHALDLRRLEAWVEPDNVASQRTLANAGFEREGRLRNFFNTDTGSTDALVFSAVP